MKQTWTFPSYLEEIRRRVVEIEPETVVATTPDLGAVLFFRGQRRTMSHENARKYYQPEIGYLSDAPVIPDID